MIYWDQLKMKYSVDVNLNNLIINLGTLRFFFLFLYSVPGYAQPSPFLVSRNILLTFSFAFCD